MTVIPGLSQSRRGRQHRTVSAAKPRPTTSVAESSAEQPGRALPPAMKRHKWLDYLGVYAITEDPIFTSTRQAEALNPALVSTHRPLAGPMVGVDVDTGNAVSCDPHILYAQGRITSPTVVMAGDVGV